MDRKFRSVAARFESKVYRCPMSGCWLWTGSTNEDGYGALGITPKHNEKAHRLAWTLQSGEIPKGMHVLHRCDVPSCVNPSHLFLGTHADNMKDMATKGRRGGGTQKINQQIADLIRADKRQHLEISIDFGVSRSYVSEIKSGRYWTERQ